MDPLKKLLILVPLLAGCQINYLIKSAYNQVKLLNNRVPIEEALNDPRLSTEEKRKLELAQQVRSFAENDLHLARTQNYNTYVQLDRPYVTYVVSAAYKWELKHYQWSYPLVGKMPYKGYFNELDAKDEAEVLNKEDFDTYLRGVSAYSTLGWFKDPLLSSMLRYKDFDLVNTLIHETVHATIYIKHEADFNERLANFLGSKGAELFYLKTEGPNSATLEQVKKDNLDEKFFSQFISSELAELDLWYKSLPEKERQESKRNDRIALIQKRFTQNIQPAMKTKNFDKFATAKLNNARLLIYKTYMQDLTDFEKLYELTNHDFSKFITQCRTLETSKDPSMALKNLVAAH